jgi:hypothetical protein
MTTSPVTTITDELLAEIEAAANAVKGWQCGQAFQVVEEGYLPGEWYWHVGMVDEEDNQYPVLLVDTAQYDQPEQAECVAHYYAAVSRDTVLEMAAELRALRAENEARQAPMVFVRDAADILRTLIENIDSRGNYSPEATALFLNQVLGCIHAAMQEQPQ